MDKIAHEDPGYAERLAALVAQMPTGRAEKIQWHRRCRKDGSIDQRALRHAFWGVDNWWDDDALAAPGPEYLRNIEPGWMWVRIDKNTRRNYITSGFALNLSDPGGEIGRADWHPMCWQVPLRGVHPRSRDCTAAQFAPLYGPRHYAETWGSLLDRGVIDVRRPLRELGHPAGDRSQPVWAASHPRAIIDQAWNAMREGILPVRRHVTPYLVARWLWTEDQFDELLEMARCLQTAAPTECADPWREWFECLSSDAAWQDEAESVRAQ